jgi:hypothetical protein
MGSLTRAPLRRIRKLKQLRPCVKTVVLVSARFWVDCRGSTQQRSPREMMSSFMSLRSVLGVRAIRTNGAIAV